MAALRRQRVTDTDAFAEFAHDLRGAMGSLRLVVSSLLDDDDPDHRGALLKLADEEVQRVAVTAGALTALGASAGDRSTPVPVDLDGAVTDAVAACTRYGVRVTVPTTVAGRVLARPAVLAHALPAVFQLASGTLGATDVTVEAVDDGVAVACSCGAMWPQARHLFARLVDAAGGRVVAGDGLRFVLPGVP